MIAELPTVVILASGRNRRWSGRNRRWSGGSKEMLPIDGVPLVMRTAGMVLGCGARLVVLSHKPEIHEALWARFSHIAQVPTIRNCTAATLASSAMGGLTWTAPMAVLLGDVLYQEGTLNAILDCREPFMAFGDQWEIYGLAFMDVDGVRSAVEQARLPSRLDRRKPLGRLRQVYNAYVGQHRDSYERPGCYTWVDDGTQDFDTPEEWEAFKTAKGE